MSTYLLIDFLIIILPFIVSFLPYLSYYKKWQSVLFSMLSGGLFFVSWDIIATARNDWSFNPEHIMGIYFYGLPLEEILFFVFVPYSLLLTYEQAEFFLRNRTVSWKKEVGYILGLILLLSAFLFTGKEYTFMALFSSGLALLIMSRFYANIMSRLSYWAYLLSGLLLFILFNYFLTSLPVVIYNPEAVTGVRFLTIPIEDFFYNYAMMTMYLAFYLLAKNNTKTLKNLIILGRFHFVFGGLLLYALGFLLAAASGITLSSDRFLWGYLILFFAHLSVSYSNDFFDAEGDKHSKPTKFSGGSGVLVKHPELAGTAKNIALSLIALSFIAAALFILAYNFSPMLLLFVFLGSACGWYYSAPPLRFSHKLYGNIIFALVICILVPGFGNYIASGTITPGMWLFAVPMLFYGYAFTIGVQIPDIEADRINKKRNYASTYGEETSFKTIAVLALIASASIYAIPYFFISKLDYGTILLLSLFPLAASLFGLTAKKQKTETKVLLIISSIFLFAGLCDLYLFTGFL
jgi:1,4-dihydroxy-2-naphthoate octaprenyltransferase